MSSRILPRFRSKIWLLLAVMFYPPPVYADTLCSYQSFTWDTRARQSVNRVRIVKPYAELSAEEIDSYTGCSVCEQDQRSIRIVPLAPFKVCRLLAPRLERELRRLLREGMPIDEIVGYRVGRTRGHIDDAGLRTRFSNHSFGVAIDINPDHNGLYDNCLTFSPECRLIRGGHWDPARPESLRADGDIVNAMESIGLEWGGEIEGWQKDFMHFSPSGY